MPGFSSSRRFPLRRRLPWVSTRTRTFRWRMAWNKTASQAGGGATESELAMQLAESFVAAGEASRQLSQEEILALASRSPLGTFGAARPRRGARVAPFEAADPAEAAQAGLVGAAAAAALPPASVEEAASGQSEQAPSAVAGCSVWEQA